jgi:phage baseplate assembly protein gpV
MDTSFEWATPEETEDESGEDRKFYGVVTGQVVDILDPLMLGRVRVRLSFLDSVSLSAWARVSVPMGGVAHGTYFIPNPGDNVLVAFEHGDVTMPYIIGSLWTAVTPPPMPTPVPQIRMIRTPIGNQITFTEVPPSISISSPGETSSVRVTPAGIFINSGTTLLTINEAGIQMVVGNTTLMLAKGGAVLAGTAVGVQATGTITLFGATVNIT